MVWNISDLPNTLRDHPEDARISAAMGDVVRGLARRTTVCVVSGRDRPADYALASVGEVERFLDRLAP